ncbi:MAG TPA: YhjD/YihY/BrkB family envelope integrity protein [Gaiellaceae bacterium]|nr:YhjD/YihY/BrkB family envelope integrity protein [Gaiellaceae bacterium]
MSLPPEEENGRRGSRHGRGHEPRVIRAAHDRTTAVSRRGREWVERQDPASRPGVAIEAWRRYRAVDGPLQSALLSLYVLVAIVPALLVMEEYLETNPAALANHIVHHYRLNGSTASLVHGVLVQDRTHELGSALFAIAGALFFGLGFGRVLQLVHARAWQIPLPARQTDQARYAAVLLGLYGLILLLLVQLTELGTGPSWARWAVVPGWICLLVVFFLWAPRLLMHKLITRRDLLPGAVVTAVGLVLLMLVSRFVMRFWVDLYARDYGGFGVVMAIFFWIAFSSAVIVWAVSISPPLAARRAAASTDR